MKTGFCVFLAALAAFGLSFYGFVCGPLQQLGTAKQTMILQSSDTWPQQRTGEATLGLQVYRQYGCAACHTEQVRQTGAVNEISVLSFASSHGADEFKGFVKSLMILPEFNTSSNVILANLDTWNGQLPMTLYSGDDSTVIGALAEKLKPAGIKTDPRLVATGADIARGWGMRQSVAADYLYDEPVQLGSMRVGPDLSNVGVRIPDANTILAHLFSPTAVVKNSTMPPFKFLFEVRKIKGERSPDALTMPADALPVDGTEIVPTQEARELAAYLLSLKANVPLYEAPFTPVTAAK